MTALQQIKLNRFMHTNQFNISDTDMLLYYKAYTKIYCNWEHIVDQMNIDTLYSIYPHLKNIQKIY